MSGGPPLSLPEPWTEEVPSAEAYDAAVARLLGVPRIADRLQRSSQTAWIMLWHARNGGKDVHPSGWSIRYRRGPADGPALLWKLRHENGDPAMTREPTTATAITGRLALYERWEAPGAGDWLPRSLQITRSPEPSLAHLATVAPVCACMRKGFKLPLDRLTLAIAAEQSRATPRDRDGRLFVNVPVL